MQIGMRIYYDKTTGDILVNTGERQGDVIETTIEHDIQVFKALSERNRGTFDYIELEYGQYGQDFIECNGYRINPQTKELEFSYPDGNEEIQEPEYQMPLSQKVAELDATLEDLLFDVIPSLIGGDEQWPNILLER